MSTGFVRHFHTCNTHDLSRFAPFFIGGKQLGWVTKELAASLPRELDFLLPRNGGGMMLAPELDTFDKRSEALAKATLLLATRMRTPLRKEMYPVVERWGDEPIAQIDRVAVPWFGVRGFGVHVNGFTRKPLGIHLWVGKRAADRAADPGKLDNMIGGGQPIGLTLEENLAKEAYEEAGFSANIARQAKQVSTLRYMLERSGGLRNDTLFVYDLELPNDIRPANTDGEVAGFQLMSLLEVAEIIRTTDRFKFNCNLVVIDFLIRHGFLNEKDEEFNEINGLLAIMKTDS